MEGAGFAFALHQGEHGSLAGAFPAATLAALVLVPVLRLAAHVSLVDLNGRAFAAKRAALSRVQFCVGLPDAMRHEPRGAVGAETEHPPKLMRAHALLAGREQVHREKPLVQRDMGPLKERADGRRKVARACLALVEAWTGRFAV